MADIKIPLSADQRAPDLNGSVEKLVEIQSRQLAGVGSTYKPLTRYRYTGLSNPTEYLAEHFVNNLGYLDKMRRPERSQSSTRILVMGTCTTHGHTEDMYHHPVNILEGLLEHTTGRSFEVINMGAPMQEIGVHYFYYDKLARPYKPDIAIIELVGSLGVVMTMPESAKVWHMSADDKQLPMAIFRPGPDGKLVPQPASAEFYKHKVKDQAVIAARDQEIKDKTVYHVNGVDFRFVFHKPSSAWTPAELAVFEYYKSVIQETKARLEADGVKVLFVSNDLQGTYAGTKAAPPNTSRANFDANMQQICKQVNAHCLDYDAYYRGKYPDSRQRHFRRDTHYSRVGYRWFAEAVDEYLKRTRFLEGPPQFWPTTAEMPELPPFKPTAAPAAAKPKETQPVSAEATDAKKQAPQQKQQKPQSEPVAAVPEPTKAAAPTKPWWKFW